MADKPQNIINHIGFIIDASGSMGHLTKEVVKVFDEQVANLVELSKNLNQETRVSVYQFDNVVENLIFDMDVLRLPSLKDIYKIGGSTALVDATLQGIEDLKLTCQLYGDHSFLLFVITDGGENASRNKGDKLAKLIGALPDNWTVATFVPDQMGKFAAQKFGFPNDNIMIWNATSQGLKETNKTITQATTNYFTQRSKGIRSTKNLFSLDTSNLNTSVVNSTLVQLKPSEYSLYPVNKDVPIKDWVEGFTKQPYVIGSAYYQLTKPEKIQAAKQICVQNKKNGKLYSGRNARDLLGLPDVEVKVAPVSYADFNIFVQSTSVNRKLIGGTNVLVMK